MNLILLGSGNAATRLGLAFRQAGHCIVRIYSRNPENGRHLARLLDPDSEIQVVSQPENICSGICADAVISALRDSAAENVWRRIRFGQCPVFHTAGSMPLSALKPYAVHYGVLYPLQTLSRNRALDFRKVPLFLEAESPETMDLLKTLAYSVSDRVLEADSEMRKNLHIAAVFANNFSNHMFAVAEKLLRENGLDLTYLLPLIDETTAKIHELSPRQAQTGPAVRFDENIIQLHLSRLSDDDAALYETVSKSIHRMTTAGITPSDSEKN